MWYTSVNHILILDPETYIRPYMYVHQERMMTSIFIVEEEHVTAKNSKQAESPMCTKNRNITSHKFAVPRSTTSQRTITLVINQM